jgi:hypothetical protein
MIREEVALDMRYKTPPLPIALLTAAALALPAAASASYNPPWQVIPVPAGEVQHTVTETTFQSNETVPGKTPWDRIEEKWAGTNAARNVLTNAENGQLISECTGTASSYSCYDADLDSGLQLSGAEGPNTAPGQSWGTEGSKIKLEIAKGWLRPTGSTTFLGRPANTYVGSSTEVQRTVIVDAATGYPLEEAVLLSYGSQTATQISKVTAFETLTPAAAAQDLAATAHPGATGSRVKRPSTSKSRSLKRHKRHGMAGNEKPAARR